MDGINTQDQNYKGQSGGDGFYTMVTARPDAIQEVTVSTAASGSDSTGAGAVQISFVTRSGNNDYNGGLYWYHRNPWLNCNYWFNNRDVAPSYEGDGPGRGQACTAQQLATEWDNCKAKRPRFLLNQYGGRVGGPISIPKLFSGNDRAFFFLNLESFRMPNGETRSNTIYDPAVEQGNYIYLYKKSGQPDQVLSAEPADTGTGQRFHLDDGSHGAEASRRHSQFDDEGGKYPDLSDRGGSLVSAISSGRAKEWRPAIT